MGSTISKDPLTPFNKDLISTLKQKKFNEIAPILETLHILFPLNNTLSFEEFEETFTDFFPDSSTFFELLQNSHSVTGVIDIYECIAAIVMFSGEELEEKLRFIFFLFDFNGSQAIEEKELILSFQSTIRGLCKLVNMPVPSLDEIEELAKKMFNSIDYDKNKSIDFEEFKAWLLDNYEMQEFLLKYTGTQTFENAKKRFNYYFIKYKSIFAKVAGSDVIETVDLESLLSVLKKDMSDYHDIASLEALSKSLIDTSIDDKDTSVSMISKTPYLDIMKAWAAFTATDINNDGNLDKNELKFLIYAYDGTKADIFRIEHELKIMDKDGSGCINRDEWLNFLSTDPNNSGKRIFRSNLRNLFSKYDKDNSGILTKEEIFNLLKENFKIYKKIAQEKGDETYKNFDGMVESLAKEVMEELENDDSSGLSWGEFKNYMEKCAEKESKLKLFLETHL